MKISVLGGGAFGTALAAMLAMRHDTITLWMRNDANVAEVNSKHTNQKYLAGISLPENVVATDDLNMACQADVILCVTPAQSFADLIATISPMLSPQSQLVLCAKGIDKQSGQFLHELAIDAVGAERVTVLSGPSFAIDIASGKPTAVSLAGCKLSDVQELAATLSTPLFRIYATDDVAGVAAGGALKNVLSLAVGIARGMGLGASAEAALITRGFAEMSRLSLALGGKVETLSGLSGLGDLALSCSSEQSRNFSYGMALARGKDLKNLPLAEGVATADMAYKLAVANDIDAPIIETVTKVLNQELTAIEAVKMLLARPLKAE